MPAMHTHGELNNVPGIYASILAGHALRLKGAGWRVRCADLWSREVRRTRHLAPAPVQLNRRSFYVRRYMSPRYPPQPCRIEDFDLFAAELDEALLGEAFQ